MKLFRVIMQKPIPDKRAKETDHQRVYLVHAVNVKQAEEKLRENAGTVWPILTIVEAPSDVILYRA